MLWKPYGSLHTGYGWTWTFTHSKDFNKEQSWYTESDCEPSPLPVIELSSWSMF
jgi:hypothetical protein